jgi:hypothetical protein
VLAYCNALRIGITRFATQKPLPKEKEQIHKGEGLLPSVWACWIDGYTCFGTLKMPAKSVAPVPVLIAKQVGACKLP